MDTMIENGMKAQFLLRAEALAAGETQIGWKSAFGSPAAMEKMISAAVTERTTFTAVKAMTTSPVAMEKIPSTAAGEKTTFPEVRRTTTCSAAEEKIQSMAARGMTTLPVAVAMTNSLAVKTQTISSSIN